MKQNERTSFFVKLLIVTFICFSMIMLVKLGMDYSDLKKKNEQLRGQIEDYENEVEKLKSDIDHPLDDEYIIRIARERLNYCMPEEIIFYNNG